MVFWHIYIYTHTENCRQGLAIAGGETYIMLSTL